MDKLSEPTIAMKKYEEHIQQQKERKMNKTIHQAIFEFNNMMITVKKDLKNGAFPNSFYTDINSVLHTIRPTLSELGIVIIQTPQINEAGSYLNTKIMLKDTPTEYVESNIKFIVDQNSPKAMWSLGASITYTRRYAITCMLSLEAVDDDFVNGTKDAQSTPKKAYNKPLTPAQQFGAKVVSMKKDLDMARAEGDIDKATRIYEEADDKGLIQVQDYHARLFENPVATL